MWAILDRRSEEQKRQDEKIAAAVKTFSTLRITRNSLSIEACDLEEKVNESRERFKNFVKQSA